MWEEERWVSGLTGSCHLSVLYNYILWICIIKNCLARQEWGSGRRGREEDIWHSELRALEASCAQNTSGGLFGALQKREREREPDRNRQSRTHRGMRVRYVKTLAKASSGMSLKAEHSGSVMMTLESSPRPPGRKNIKRHSVRFQSLTLATKNPKSKGQRVKLKPNQLLEDVL